MTGAAQGPVAQHALLRKPSDIYLILLEVQAIVVYYIVSRLCDVSPSSAWCVLGYGPSLDCLPMHFNMF
jgi:hypothetical protein